jgi:hypothetical protein
LFLLAYPNNMMVISKQKDEVAPTNGQKEPIAVFPSPLRSKFMPNDATINVLMAIPKDAMINVRQN